LPDPGYVVQLFEVVTGLGKSRVLPERLPIDASYVPGAVRSAQIHHEDMIAPVRAAGAALAVALTGGIVTEGRPMPRSLRCAARDHPPHDPCLLRPAFWCCGCLAAEP